MGMQSSNLFDFDLHSNHQIQSNRPRSNSEGKSKKPNLIMSTLRKSMYLPWSSSSSSSSSATHSSSSHHHHQHHSHHNHNSNNCSSLAKANDHLHPHQHQICIDSPDTASSPIASCHHDLSNSCSCPDKPRSRSGSGGSDRVSAPNPMSRVIDIFRNRSLSVGYNEIRRVSCFFLSLKLFDRFFSFNAN